MMYKTLYTVLSVLLATLTLSDGQNLIFLDEYKLAGNRDLANSACARGHYYVQEE